MVDKNGIDNWNLNSEHLHKTLQDYIEEQRPKFGPCPESYEDYLKEWSKRTPKYEDTQLEKTLQELMVTFKKALGK